jgi:hypothetical protein
MLHSTGRLDEATAADRDEERDGAVVDQVDRHVGAEASRLDRQPRRAPPAGDAQVKSLGGRVSSCSAE